MSDIIFGYGNFQDAYPRGSSEAVTSSWLDLGNVFYFPYNVYHILYAMHSMASFLGTPKKRKIKNRKIKKRKNVVLFFSDPSSFPLLSLDKPKKTITKGSQETSNSLTDRYELLVNWQWGLPREGKILPSVVCDSGTSGGGGGGSDCDADTDGGDGGGGIKGKRIRKEKGGRWDQDKEKQKRDEDR
ncbi:hypothetical protein M0802_001231 [Mischocyttarus mexicanus]|nr:hypothetical protein M0802_001231 [Mischocyttarus mexicanus]